MSSTRSSTPLGMSSGSDCRLIGAVGGVSSSDSHLIGAVGGVNSSDYPLFYADQDDSASVFITHHSFEDFQPQCTCTCDYDVDIERPGPSTLRREHSQRHSQRSHRSRSGSVRSSVRSTSSRRPSTRRTGSQRHHRKPSRHGSTRDKKRLLSEQRSDCSVTEQQSSGKPRRAVQIIITVAVTLILMSIVIVAATLLMSGKMEEMVRRKVVTSKPDEEHISQASNPDIESPETRMLVHNAIASIPNRRSSSHLRSSTPLSITPTMAAHSKLIDGIREDSTSSNKLAASISAKIHTFITSTLTNESAKSN